MFPPISCELLMGSSNQISAWSRREVADYGCFYVNLELHTTQEFITGEMALQRLTPAFTGAASGHQRTHENCASRPPLQRLVRPRLDNLEHFPNAISSL